MISKTRFVVVFASLQIIRISGYQMYDESTEICCGGSVSAKATATTSCCGSSTYNEAEQACCNGVLQPFPVEGSPHYACCGSAAYSHKQQTCCGAAHLYWGASLHCCGENLYDYATKECCEDTHAFQRQKDHECCGGNFYRLAVHGSKACCVIHDDGSTEAHMYDFTNKTECCGLQLYDYQEEVCCDSQLLPKPKTLGVAEWGVCCGGAIITDHKTQLCCNDAIVKRDGNEYECCGTGLYNRETQTCCGLETIDNDSDRACCLEAQVSFDLFSQACCGSEVVNLTLEEINDLLVKDACCSASNSVALG